MLKSRLEYPFDGQQLAVSTVVGAAVFPAVLGLAQVAAFRPLQIACSRGAISSLCGGVAVGVAGFAASVVTIKTCSAVQIWQKSTNDGYRTASKGHVSVTLPELAVSSVSAVVLFRALGGRFSSVLPSHLMRPGAFAREGILAGSSRNASEVKRAAIQLLGRQHGCHTCGRRRTSQFIADHQPPTKLFMLNENTATFQQLLPQCPRCSGLQGGLLSNLGSNSKAICPHLFSLRQYHVFLPLPLGLAWLRAQHSSPVKDSNSLQEEPSREVAVQTGNSELATVSQTGTKATLSSILTDSDLSNLATNFPLLIVWKKVVGFLDSFHSCGAFHITVWVFSIVVALGTI